jgi:hypothetical protein
METIDFKTGQILNFSNSDTFLNKAILWFTKMKYPNADRWFEHCAIIGDMTENKVEVYEAVSNGFIKSYYDKTSILGNSKIAVGYTTIPLTNVKENCEKYLGRSYGWFDIWNLAMIYVFGRTSKFFKFFKGSKSLICSEALARILYDASGKQLVLGYDDPTQTSEFNKYYDEITPEDIYLSKYMKWMK